MGHSEDFSNLTGSKRIKYFLKHRKIIMIYGIYLNNIVEKQIDIKN